MKTSSLPFASGAHASALSTALSGALIGMLFLLTAPATQAQDAPAVPLRTLMLDADALADEAAALDADADRAERLGLRAPAASAATDATRADSREAASPRQRSPLGNARFPAWNLPPQVGNKATVYANVAAGQITDEFDSSGDMRSIGSEVPQFGGPLGLNANGQAFRVDGEIVGQPQLSVSLQDAAELVDGLDPDAIPPGIEGQVYAGGRLRGTVNTFNVNLGGFYNLLTSPTFSVGVGADFQAAQQNFSTDDFVLDAGNARASLGGSSTLVTIQQLLQTIGSDAEVPDEVVLTPEQSGLVPDGVDSGFNAQALTLFLQAQNQLLSLRTGFQFDLGPEPEGSSQREISDRQNAVLLGLTLNYPVNPNLRTYFGVDGWFTLPSEEDQRGLNGEVIEGLENIRYDEGNTYATQLGADYQLPFLDGLAAGAALNFRWRTRATIEEAEVMDPSVIGDDDPETEIEFERRTVVENERGYHLGIAPYVNYTPPGSSFQLYLKGGVRDEYREFSFSILGENEFAPRRGATLGAVYNL